ncbi:MULTISPECIES: DUF736 family protein [Alphaproteobacteria]|uniref:DUF736 family protein n=1 Tax=Alphaproteobacteria TaxID=28211 RepID=UPI00326792DA
MTTIGYVTKSQDIYKGKIKTITIDTEITIIDNLAQASGAAPDFIVLSGNFPIGTGRAKTASKTQRDYITLYFDSPDLPAHFFVNMIQDEQQDDPDAYVLIWDQKRQEPKT